MQVHEKKPGDTKVKTLVLFCAAPPSEYDDPATFDGADLSDIVLPSGNVIPIVDNAKYLGSMMDRDCTDERDVEARVAAATKAFGALSKCIFKSPDITLPAKREAYVALVLSILLYGCECWCLTEKLWAKLSTFHHSCARRMCRISMWHTWKSHISSASVLQALGLRSIRTYTVRRQLQWAGHMARMPLDRLPRKLLTSWCYQARPLGRPELTYGEGLKNALEYARVPVATWMAQAQDKLAWKDTLLHIREPTRRLQHLPPVLVARSGWRPPPPPSPPRSSRN
jgi:hypothetical protein